MRTPCICSAHQALNSNSAGHDLDLGRSLEYPFNHLSINKVFSDLNHTMTRADPQWSCRVKWANIYNEYKWAAEYRTTFHSHGQTNMGSCEGALKVRPSFRGSLDCV